MIFTEDNKTFLKGRKLNVITVAPNVEDEGMSMQWHVWHFNNSVSGVVLDLG